MLLASCCNGNGRCLQVQNCLLEQPWVMFAGMSVLQAAPAKLEVHHCLPFKLLHCIVCKL